MEQLAQSRLVQVRSDHAQSARDGCRAAADIRLARDIVKVEETAVCGGHNAFCAQNKTADCFISQRFECLVQFCLGISAGGFNAPAGEHIVRVVMMIMTVIVTAAAFAVLMLVFMMMFVIVVMVAMLMMMFILMIVMVVLMLMMVTADRTDLLAEQFFQLMREGLRTLDRLDQLRAGKRIPIGGDHRRIGI